MDELERYWRILDEMKIRTLDDDRASYELLADGGHAGIVMELIRSRRQLLAPPDIMRVADFVGSGLLPGIQHAEERAAAFCVALELEDLLKRARRNRACKPYDRSQPLFQCAPGMWDRVRAAADEPGDLLLGNDLTWDGTGQLVRIDGKNWSRLDSDLRPDVVRALLADRKGRTFIRLDPFKVGPQLAPLAEATIRPADPSWWQILEIWPGGEKHAQYNLNGFSTEDLSDYWDYHARGLRRLEVSFRRRNSGHFFGSIEELSCVSDNYLTGLMLHMDSIDPVGVEWKNATLGHLDGAINIYEGKTASERFQTNHAAGKVPNATCRTHLFRVDNVPIGILIPIAHGFFRSSRLLAEWVRDQFGIG